MKRRTKWGLGLGIAIPALLIVALWIVLRLSVSSPEAALSSIEVKDLPIAVDQGSAWVPAAEDEGNGRETARVSPTTIDAFDLPISGTLVMASKEKPFGEESFDLSLEGEQVVLRSDGRFWFKTLIATLAVTYDQVLRMDAWLRPMSLSLAFDAPLGFGRKTQAEFDRGRAVVQSGDDKTEYSVDLDRAFVLGTFSTYAVIPLLYELREYDGTVELDTLVFGGPPAHDDEADAEEDLPETRVSRLQDVVIAFAGREMTVSQYEISGSMGAMRLFALGVEILGLLAGDDEESLFVYRADYFEDGFTLVTAVSE